MPSNDDITYIVRLTRMKTRSAVFRQCFGVLNMWICGHHKFCCRLSDVPANKNNFEPKWILHFSFEQFFFFSFLNGCKLLFVAFPRFYSFVWLLLLPFSKYFQYFFNVSRELKDCSIYNGYWLIYGGAKKTSVEKLCHGLSF